MKKDCDSSMIEKYEIEVVLDVYDGNEDLEDTLDEMKAYQKTYEHDSVSVLEIKGSNVFSNKKQYQITLQVERDLSNLGRIYKSEEEKLFGFDEDQDEED